MRWKLVLAVPALLLVVNATIVTAQDSIPVTVTLEPHHPVVEVRLYLPDGTQLGQTVYRPDGLEAEQTYVADLPSSGIPPRYDMIAEAVIGASQHPHRFSFSPEDRCTVSEDKQALRIACSAVRHGAGLVCTAIYEGMGELGAPGDTCGSHACIYCNRIKVCGADPDCP